MKLNDLKVRTLLASLLTILLVVMALATMATHFALDSALTTANRQGLAKDLVADILPPPMYVLEAEMTAMDLLHGPASRQAQNFDRLTQLRKDFDDRVTYWSADHDLDSEAKISLLGKHRETGQAFFSELDHAFVAAIRSGNRTEAEQSLSKLRALYDAHRAEVDKTVQLGTTLADDQQKAMERVRTRALTVALVLLGSTALLAALFFRLVGRSILSRLGNEPAELTAAARRMANGDLKTEIIVEAGGENSMAAAMRQMQVGLARLIGTTKSEAADADSAANRLASAASSVNAAVNDQSEASASVASAVEELSTSVDTIAEHAADVKTAAESSRVRAQTGAAIVATTTADIARIVQSTRATVHSVRELSARVADIEKLTTTIKDIAGQTNLLALNAAIEAARAGEAGRGFAVVSDEVRKLAEKVDGATREIFSLTEKVMADTASVEASIQDMTSVTDASQAGAKEAESVIIKIEEDAGRTARMITEVSEALIEQRSAVQSISRSLEGVSQSAESSSAAAAEVSSLATQVRDLAAALNASAGQFRI